MTENLEKISKMVDDLANKAKTLAEENFRLKVELDSCVRTYKICGLCKHLHGDCDPADPLCYPEWKGLM